MDTPRINAPESLVENLALFDGIPAGKIPSVMRCLGIEAKAFDKGARLTQRKDVKPAVTQYLAQGEAQLVRYDSDGNRSILETLPAEAVLSYEEEQSILPGIDCYAIASEPCLVFYFSITSEIEARPCCLKHTNQVRANLIVSLTATVARLVRKLETLSNRSIREKALAYLGQQAKLQGSRTFSLPCNRQELADLLYIERSALSRELGRMRDEGIISFQGNTFTLR